MCVFVCISGLFQANKDTGGCEKITTLEKQTRLEGKLVDHRIEDWRAVSAAGLQGKGSHKGVLFPDTCVAARQIWNHGF